MATTIKRKMPRDVSGLSSGEKSTARTGLGLGDLATQEASAVAITGGSITGITDMAVADGGTGSSTASGARTNLGLSRAVIAVDTIAALKALTVAPALSQVEVLGYYAAGDGGGGLFLYDAGSSSADDGGTVIAPTVGTGRWLRRYDGPINPKWFGVTMDGLTDDTTRMQACLDFVRTSGGGVIQFPSGGGTMILTQSVKIGSFTTILLNGCTVKAKQSGFVGVNTGTDSTTNCQLFKNYNHSALELTDSDISVEGPGVFDYGTVTVSGGGTHCISLRMVDGGSIRKITGVGGNNVTAIRGCRDVITDSCVGIGQSNASFDHWEGFTSVTVRNCIVRGDPSIDISQGIQFNSGGNPGDSDVSSDGIIEGCRIYGVRSALGSATAIALGSLTATSVISNFKTIGNYVEDADIGLNIAGNGYGHVSIGDTFRNVDVLPIFIQSNDGASPEDSKVLSPTLIDCANEAGSVALISITGNGNEVRGVRVINTSSAAYEYIGYFTSGSSGCLIEIDNADDGTTGRFFNQGTQSKIIDTLNQYTDGAWTPALAFGGGSTGVTYASREGKYRMVGKLCFVTGFINLTSKGSSTGSASITLPFTASANNAPGVVGVNNADGMTGLTSSPNLAIAASASVMVPQHFSSSKANALTDANFTNSSFIFYSGVYEIA